MKHLYRSASTSWTGIPYKAAFWLWRKLPKGRREFFFRNSFMARLKKIASHALAKGAGRDDIYNKEYYSYVDQESKRSAPHIVHSIVRDFNPTTVLDVGCGTGALLSAFNAAGVKGIGLEYSITALALCRERKLEVLPFNIESSILPIRKRFDLVTCFEVAEHLHEQYANRLVFLLSEAASKIVFTAALPGQGGGVDHINEQPHEYWIDKFVQFGFHFDKDKSQQWRKEWENADVSSFYSQNVMFFTANSNSVA